MNLVTQTPVPNLRLHPPGWKLVGEILRERHSLPQNRIEDAALIGDPVLRFLERMIKAGLCTESQALDILSMQMGVEAFRPSEQLRLDPDDVSILPEEWARSLEAIVLEKKAPQMRVVMRDPLDKRALDALRVRTGLVPVPLVGLHWDIAHCQQQGYRLLVTQSKTSKAREGDRALTQSGLETRQPEESLEVLLDDLFDRAVVEGASDIHVEGHRDRLLVRLRVDGNLKTVARFSPEQQPLMVSRIKVLANLDIAEKRIPQDGRFTLTLPNAEMDVRVSILPTTHGEKAVLRLFDKSKALRNLGELGLDAPEYALLDRQLSRPNGIVIVTGPTGSGKSTTLYAALQMLTQERRNVVTVEDPVEYDVEGASQVQVHPKIGLTFATALRSILRQDPDVVLVGEIRDRETADIAVKMALTGHLVLSTLHTNDAASTIVRLLDIGIPPLLLASALNCVVAQRLVRRICRQCREPFQPGQEIWDDAELEGQRPGILYRGKGCVHCNGSGYKGRMAIFELMECNDTLHALIFKNASTDAIRAAAKDAGMKTLRQAGLSAVLQGQTTLEEILGSTQNH